MLTFFDEFLDERRFSISLVVLRLFFPFCYWCPRMRRWLFRLPSPLADPGLGHAGFVFIFDLGPVLLCGSVLAGLLRRGPLVVVRPWSSLVVPRVPSIV